MVALQQYKWFALWSAYFLVLCFVNSSYIILCSSLRDFGWFLSVLSICFWVVGWGNYRTYFMCSFSSFALGCMCFKCLKTIVSHVFPVFLLNYYFKTLFYVKVCVLSACLCTHMPGEVFYHVDPKGEHGSSSLRLGNRYLLSHLHPDSRLTHQCLR